MAKKRRRFQLQISLVLGDLSHEKLFDAEAVVGFLEKAAEAVGVDKTKVRAYANKMTHPDARRNFIAGMVAEPQIFVMVASFPFIGEIELMINAYDHPGEDKAEIIQKLAHNFFAK